MYNYTVVISTGMHPSERYVGFACGVMDVHEAVDSVIEKCKIDTSIPVDRGDVAAVFKGHHFDMWEG